KHLASRCLHSFPTRRSSDLRRHDRGARRRILRQGATGPERDRARARSGLDLRLPALVLPGRDPPGGLEQHRVPERLDAERAVGDAGPAARRIRSRGDRRAHGREAGPGAAGLADAGAVRPDRARHHRIPGICRRAGGPQAPVHGRVGDPVPGVLHLPRLAPQEGILARRALRRDREARSPEKRPMMATSPRMRNALTLFSSVDDVLCHRVRLVLAAKGVTYDFIPVDPQNPPEDLIDLNPYHSVPTLVERDLVLYAASVVSEYLDERYPHPPLMPVDPLSRARLRLAMLRIEHDWVPQVQAIQLGN